VRSKSRNVNAYVKAKRKLWAVTEKLAVQEAKLEPLKRKRALALAESIMRHRKLTGWQMGEAERMLRALEDQDDDRKGAAR
jgi:hypothetical protein